MAPHSSTLAWKIPWMEEPGRLQSTGVTKSRTRLKRLSSSSRGHLQQGSGKQVVKGQKQVDLGHQFRRAEKILIPAEEEAKKP